jgi:transposase InsO family protein
VPWDNNLELADQRMAFLALLAEGSCSFACACGRFGISRKTGYKWRDRAASEQPQPLLDRSRRPLHSPGRTPLDQEQKIIEVRDEFLWGAKKIHAHLHRQEQDTPSARTVHNVLRRHNRVGCGGGRCPPCRFERCVPNELWQMDFKGPLTVEGRPRYLLSLLDDHSRYALALRLCPDQTMATVWPILWGLFGETGLPEGILSDNGFAPRGPSTVGLSWLEARLSRLGVQTPHGRPYHPQTQGKVERWHRTLAEELFPRLDWQHEAVLVEQMEDWRVGVYNAIRPHEALGYDAPCQRWYGSERPRPACLPAVSYPEGMQTRKVMQKGEISWRGFEILVGSGLYGERVGVREDDGCVVLLYGRRELRRLEIDQLQHGRVH